MTLEEKVNIYNRLSDVMTNARGIERALLYDEDLEMIKLFTSSLISDAIGIERFIKSIK